MIGNDVVNLLQSRTESNLQRKGFLDKLFCPQEQQMIHEAQDAEQMTWRLWSMKEAAYKIYNRQTGIRAFMPLSLCCTIEDAMHGMVSYNGNLYFTKTTVTDNLIHTIAVCDTDDFSLIYEPEMLQVLKDSNGLPYTKDESGLLYPASISHHGKQLKIVALQRELASVTA
jgi:phosphopantetheinyl transferase (holo-ACP synthase)